MARWDANPDQEAREAFRREIKSRRAYADMTQSRLADELGVVPSAVSDMLSNPDKITAARMRKIVRLLRPDPIVVLMFLGYTKKDLIQKGGNQ